MAKKATVPRFVRLSNTLTTALLRAGVRPYGPGHAPMYLLTVRGRKSGQPRTTPLVIIEQKGKRYLVTPYGVVDWVRNLRAAGTATLTRGRRAEEVRAIELSPDEAGRVLKAFVATGNPFGRFFGVSGASSDEDVRRAATSHPVFLLQDVAANVAEATGHAQPER